MLDTGVFDGDRYFDVFAEYAKGAPDDLLIRLTVANRGPEPATLHLLPTLWFRNTWSWGRTGEGYWPRGRIARHDAASLVAQHASLGKFRLVIDTPAGHPAPGRKGFRGSQAFAAAPRNDPEKPSISPQNPDRSGSKDGSKLEHDVSA